MMNALGRVTLYHVTPVTNLPSIRTAGVNPTYAQGRQKKCWWVTEDKLNWAIAHTSARHDISARRLVVCVAVFDRASLERCGLFGVYKVNFPVDITNSYPAFSRLREIR